jgi:site-specific DNA-methyltransferase (adenine-specific)
VAQSGNGGAAGRKRRGPSRRPTATSNFGVGRRESHDATGFYQRFEPPELSADNTVAEPYAIDDPFKVGDARQMDAVRDNSVALVVTSPPYFAGKQYEEELEREGVPSSYREYLQMLTDVFAECKRTLEPGGRIAVNVANLGRKPYRSLSADVIAILQDDLHLLVRGEVIWRKGEGATGSCAWGSYRSPANPVLRDVTERIVIASKGRFARAHSARQREQRGLPHEANVDADEFMAATLDVWEIAPESARRVQHPAPFPVELPERLIRLYTYRNDLVVDPFMGSGSALVAAARLGRRYVGYDLDPQYARIARRRVEQEVGDERAATPGSAAAAGVAEELVAQAGFEIVARSKRLTGTGLAVSFVATDADGARWYFDVSGAFTVNRGGLFRTDGVFRALGRGHVLAAKGYRPLVLLTTDLPRRGSEPDRALRAGAGAFFDAVDLRSDEAAQRLRVYAKGNHTDRPAQGFWSEQELDRIAGT